MKIQQKNHPNSSNMSSVAFGYALPKPSLAASQSLRTFLEILEFKI
jgi:hypothetical protein